MRRSAAAAVKQGKGMEVSMLPGVCNVSRVFLTSVLVSLLVVSYAHGVNGQAGPPFGPLPKSFDPPFAPQHINPETATISLTPGFEEGRYDVRISLAETTLYDDSHKPTRNYSGEFVLQGISLPTDNFHKLAEKEFKRAADEQMASTIIFTQVPRADEHIRKPFGQRYPVVVDSIRFGRAHRHVIYMEIYFQVDFAATGPPNPWSEMASVNPYQIARQRDDAPGPGYPKKEWDAFRALVKETDAIWKRARYATNIRVLLNHRYESSVGMNTHER